MKFNKISISYGIVLIVFVAYLISADYLFNIIIKTDKEARIANIKIPAETRNMKFALDEVKEVTLKWKDALSIKGWVFQDQVKSNKRNVLCVLSSEKDTLVFTIQNDTIPRPDVTTAFKMDPHINNHGIELYIPLYRLKDNSWQVGFVIKDETGTYFSNTNKAIVVSDHAVKLVDQVPQYPAKLIPLTIQETKNEISHFFDLAAESGKYFQIVGWGFIKGLDTDRQKSYILLKKDKSVLIFDSRMQIRKDITTGFSQYQKNLDSSGFVSQIPLEKLEKGRYQIGVHLVKGDQTGTAYSDKFIDVDK